MAAEHGVRAAQAGVDVKTHRGRAPREAGVLGRRDRQDDPRVPAGGARSGRPGDRADRAAGRGRVRDRHRPVPVPLQARASSSEYINLAEKTIDLATQALGTWTGQPTGVAVEPDRHGPAGGHEAPPVRWTCTSRTALAGPSRVRPAPGGHRGAPAAGRGRAQAGLSALLRRPPGRSRVRDQPGPAREPLRHRPPLPHRGRAGHRLQVQPRLRDPSRQGQGGRGRAPEARGLAGPRARRHPAPGPRRVQHGGRGRAKREGPVGGARQRQAVARRELLERGPGRRRPGRPGGRLRRSTPGPAPSTSRRSTPTSSVSSSSPTPPARTWPRCSGWLRQGRERLHRED